MHDRAAAERGQDVAGGLLPADPRNSCLRLSRMARVCQTTAASDRSCSATAALTSSTDAPRPR
ncbi:hypothetical protein ACFQV2_26860 [Actinokineospora soli]|uniref:Uncharacterized protein n=1 Tax=Actinokineospora soli TaxID=1048753 RepID=A0ABW2TT87_9PSEU